MKGSAAGTILFVLAERMGANIKTMLFTLRKRAVMMKKRSERQREVSAMLQSEKVKRAIDAVKEACGHCEVCSPDCPIAIADRALQGLYYDLQQAEQAAGDFQ